MGVMEEKPVQRRTVIPVQCQVQLSLRHHHKCHYRRNQYQQPSNQKRCILLIYFSYLFHYLPFFSAIDVVTFAGAKLQRIFGICKKKRNFLAILIKIRCKLGVLGHWKLLLFFDICKGLGEKTQIIFYTIFSFLFSISKITCLWGGCISSFKNHEIFTPHLMRQSSNGLATVSLLSPDSLTSKNLHFFERECKGTMNI